MGHGGARTKQTAKSSTGGRPPPKGRAGKASVTTSGPNPRRRLAKQAGLPPRDLQGRPVPVVSQGGSDPLYKFKQMGPFSNPPYDAEAGLAHGQPPMVQAVQLTDESAMKRLSKELAEAQGVVWLAPEDTQEREEEKVKLRNHLSKEAFKKMSKQGGEGDLVQMHKNKISFEDFGRGCASLRQATAKGFGTPHGGLGLKPLVACTAANPNDFLPAGAHYTFDAKTQMPQPLVWEEACQGGAQGGDPGWVPAVPWQAWVDALDDALGRAHKQAQRRAQEAGWGNQSMARPTLVLVAVCGAEVGEGRACGQAAMKQWGERLIKRVHAHAGFEHTPVSWFTVPAGAVGGRRRGDGDDGDEDTSVVGPLWMGSRAGSKVRQPLDFNAASYQVFVQAVWMGTMCEASVDVARAPRSDVNVAGHGPKMEVDYRYREPGGLGPPSQGGPVNPCEVLRTRFLADVLSRHGHIRRSEELEHLPWPLADWAQDRIAEVQKVVKAADHEHPDHLAEGVVLNALLPQALLGGDIKRAPLPSHAQLLHAADQAVAPRTAEVLALVGSLGYSGHVSQVAVWQKAANRPTDARLLINAGMHSQDALRRAIFAVDTRNDPEWSLDFVGAGVVAVCVASALQEGYNEHWETPDPYKPVVGVGRDPGGGQSRSGLFGRAPVGDEARPVVAHGLGGDHAQILHQGYFKMCDQMGSAYVVAVHEGVLHALRMPGVPKKGGAETMCTCRPGAGEDSPLDSGWGMGGAGFPNHDAREVNMQNHPNWDRVCGREEGDDYNNAAITIHWPGSSETLLPLLHQLLPSCTTFSLKLPLDDSSGGLSSEDSVTGWLNSLSEGLKLWGESELYEGRRPVAAVVFVSLDITCQEGIMFPRQQNGKNAGYAGETVPIVDAVVSGLGKSVSPDSVLVLGCATSGAHHAGEGHVMGTVSGMVYRAGFGVLGMDGVRLEDAAIWGPVLKKLQELGGGSGSGGGGGGGSGGGGGPEGGGGGGGGGPGDGGGPAGGAGSGCGGSAGGGGSGGGGGAGGSAGSGGGVSGGGDGSGVGGAETGSWRGGRGCKRGRGAGGGGVDDKGKEPKKVQKLPGRGGKQNVKGKTGGGAKAGEGSGGGAADRVRIRALELQERYFQATLRTVAKRLGVAVRGHTQDLCSRLATWEETSGREVQLPRPDK